MTNKEFFDWLRGIKGGKLTQADVNYANSLLATMPIDQVKAAFSNGTGEMQLSQKGYELIAQFEGFLPKPYKDGGGVWTIGFGSTYYKDGSKVKPNDPPMTREQAADLKLYVINHDFAHAVNTVLANEINQGKVSQNMFDAMVSLAYNIGVGAFSRSSIVRQLKAGNKKASADAFRLYNKDNGVVIKGLVNRREKERNLFLS